MVLLFNKNFTADCGMISSVEEVFTLRFWHCTHERRCQTTQHSKSNQSQVILLFMGRYIFRVWVLLLMEHVRTPPPVSLRVSRCKVLFVIAVPCCWEDFSESLYVMKLLVIGSPLNFHTKQCDPSAWHVYLLIMPLFNEAVVKTEIVKETGQSLLES